MGAPQYEQAGADVAGSGTPGTIPVWSTGTTLGDSPLTVSGTTVTATQAFTVNGTQTFNGNLVSGFNQTWTLNGGFLNIQSGLLYLDKTNSRIGIGTASPTSTADIFGLQTNTSGTNASAPTGTLRLNFAGASGAGQYGSSLVFSQQWFSGSPTSYVAVGQITGVKIAGSGFYGGGLAFWYGNSTVLAEGMRLDNSGNVGIGTSSPGATAHVLSPVAAAAIIASTATTTYFDIRTSTSTSIGYVGSGGMVVGAAANDLALRAITGNVVMAGPGGTLRATVGSTSLDISSVSGYGLKLPATPGNADTQTLDCYAEGTWTPTVTGFGGTAPTVTGRYTRVGRLVTLSVLVSATGGAQFSSTATTTYISLPSGMMPTTASQPGATSNSGIAADGPCVAYTNGNLYLPTFALRTADTFLTVTYMI